MATSEENIYERIINNYNTLSKNQKKIADFIINHYEEVIFFSVSQLSDRLGLSDATVVRFAKNLGQKGYPELKENLVRYYKEYITPDRRMQRSLKEFPENPYVFRSHLEKEISLLETAVQTIADEDYKKALDLIIKARRIHIFGNGGNACLASHLHFKLSRFQLDSTQNSVSGKNLLDRFLHIKTEDVVIVFHFNQVTVDFRKISDFCRDEKIPVILITDTMIPSVVDEVSIALVAERGTAGTFHSQVVPMAISNALINGIAYELKTEAVTAMEKLAALRAKYYYQHKL